MLPFWISFICSKYVNFDFKFWKPFGKIAIQKKKEEQNDKKMNYGIYFGMGTTCKNINI